MLIASIKLSQSTQTYSGMSTDMQTVENWLSQFGKLGSNTSSGSMPSNVKSAYDRLQSWMDSKECEDDDSEETNCYKGQGHWFANSNHMWSDMNGSAPGQFSICDYNSTLTATTTCYHYSQEQRSAYWNTSNQGGKKDSKKAFMLLASIKLSGSSVPTYSGMTMDMRIVENWLSETFGQVEPNEMTSDRTMPQQVKAAYERLHAWVESHDCDDDGDDD
jgi:hypothetical protein